MRSETGPDSDCDILLVVPDDAPPECRRARLAYQVLRGTGVAADVLVWTRRAFEERLRVLTSLPGAVVREGRVLIGDAVEVARAPGALSHAHTQSRR